MEKSATMEYSVIVPLLNEQESLQELWKQLKAAMVPMKKEWEVIFVDDGSTDGSLALLRTIKKQDIAQRVHIIHFRRNKGKAAALQAGFHLAKGNIVITMDADLQDDPAEVPNLVKRIHEGYDLVSGYKKIRHDPLHKTVPSRIFNYLVRKLSGLKLHDINCGLKAYRHEVVDSLHLYGDLYRFIPILAHNQGFKVTEIAVHHRPRLYGKSKYGFNRFMRGILDLTTVTFLNRFVRRPLHFFGPLGMLLVLIGLVISIYLSIIHLIGHPIGDRPLLTLGILCIISGVQLISTGLVGELITFYAHNTDRRQEDMVIPDEDSDDQ